MEDVTNKTLTYSTFEDWYMEIENYGMRCERLWESDLRSEENLLLWLKAAFEAARLTNV
jgi:hypothetical protein